MKRAMRQFLMILAVVIALPLTTAYGWSVEMMTAKQARDAALAGEIVLIDVRTADEWRATGIGDVATPITMHNNQFLTRLRTVIDQNRIRRSPLSVQLACGRAILHAPLKVRA